MNEMYLLSGPDDWQIHVLNSKPLLSDVAEKAHSWGIGVEDITIYHCTKVGVVTTEIRWRQFE